MEKLGERITRDRFFGKYQRDLCVHAASVPLGKWENN